MTRSNPYQILGVHPTADEEEIKQAYRRLAKEFHPDRNPGDHLSAERFREINLAFEILRDPKKRATFDQWGRRRAGTWTAGTSSDEGGEDFTSPFEEIFGDLMWGKPQGTAVKAERGRDLKHHMTITLEQAAAGATIPIRTDRLETCEDCRGRGAAPDARTQPCVVCGGLGYLQKQHGLRATQSACKSCGGTGQILFDVCEACGGNGGIRKERTLNVRIPPGAEEGFTLKVSREGDAGSLGGAAGDLLISLGIQPHDVFRREGRNLHISIPITMTDAALGAEVDVPTLNDPVRIRIPAGTQSGKLFSLQGKGLPRPGGGARGDVIVHIHVETPTRMSQKQRKLLEEFNRLKEIGGERSSGKSKRRGWRRLGGFLSPAPVASSISRKAGLNETLGDHRARCGLDGGPVIENSSFLLPEDSRWIVVESKGELVYIEAVASRLMELGSPGVVISGEGKTRVEGYLSNDIHLKRNLEALGTYTDSLMHLGLSGEEIESRPLPAIDWVRDFQERCVPRKVGPYRILPEFHPKASERDRPGDGEDERWIRILLTPAMAFGTGEHPTTRLCLLTLGDIFRDKKKGRLVPKRVLDLGCGSGILGIAAALSFPTCRISSVDLEPGSIHATRENARRNRVASRMTAREGSIERTQGRFDLIFANLFLEPLLKMTPILVRRLKVAGIAILSGILTHQTPRLVAALKAEGVDLIGTSSEKKWACLTMKKP